MVMDAGEEIRWLVTAEKENKQADWEKVSVKHLKAELGLKEETGKRSPTNFESVIKLYQCYKKSFQSKTKKSQNYTPDTSLT